MINHLFLQKIRKFFILLFNLILCYRFEEQLARKGLSIYKDKY